MKRILTLLSLICGLFSFGQSGQIDSLRMVVETTKSDTVKVQALFAWDELIYLSNPQLDNELNLQIAQISERNLKSNKGITDEEVEFYKDHLSNAYNVLGINQDDLGNYAEALDYYYKATWISEQRNDADKVASIQNNIGLIHEKLGNNDLALKFYLKSLRGVRKAGNLSGEINALNNIGSVKLAMRETDSTLYYYKKALELAKMHDYQYFYAATLGNVGVAFERLGEKDSALFYYYLAKPQLEELGDWDGLSNLYFNIGTIHHKSGNAKKAIEFCQEGYAIAATQSAEFRKSINCDCLFNAYTILGNADSALKYYILSDSINYRFTNIETTREIAQKEQAYLFKKERFADSLAFVNQLEIRNAEDAKESAQNKLRITLLLTSLVFVGLIWMFVYYRLRVAKTQKAEIEQKEALTRLQKEVIANQKEEIEQSINYAKLIQEATLPVKKHDLIFTDSFLMYAPKDVVSGDFYWLEEDEKNAYFSVADCTGHGIPGAFISMIGTILLNEIYNSKNYRTPNQILDELNRLVQLTLMSHSSQMKDGMDMSFCSLNKETNELHYAGANNPIWFVSKKPVVKVKYSDDWENIEPNLELNELFLYEIKADKQPIGKYHDEQQPFTLKQVQLSKGDCVYLFSDGYPDQFGGENWKKFKYKPLKRLFLSINEKSMSDQLEVIQKTFDDWKGQNEQIDDVCVLGIRV